MQNKEKPKKKLVKIQGYGVFVKAYGGLIGFSHTAEMARKIANTEYADVSMSRSWDEFKIKKVTITY